MNGREHLEQAVKHIRKARDQVVITDTSELVAQDRFYEVFSEYRQQFHQILTEVVKVERALQQQEKRLGKETPDNPLIAALLAELPEDATPTASSSANPLVENEMYQQTFLDAAMQEYHQNRQNAMDFLINFTQQLVDKTKSSNNHASELLHALSNLTGLTPDVVEKALLADDPSINLAAFIKKNLQEQFPNEDIESKLQAAGEKLKVLVEPLLN